MGQKKIVHFCSESQKNQYRVNWQTNLVRNSIRETSIICLFKKIQNIEMIFIHEHPMLVKFLVLGIIFYSRFRNIKIIFDIHDGLQWTRFRTFKAHKYCLYRFCEFIAPVLFREITFLIVSQEQRKFIKAPIADSSISCVSNFGGVFLTSQISKKNYNYLNKLRFCYFGYIDENKIDLDFYEKFFKEFDLSVYGVIRNQSSKKRNLGVVRPFNNSNFVRELGGFDCLIYVPGKKFLASTESYLNIKVLQALALGLGVLVAPESKAILELFKSDEIEILNRRLMLVLPTEYNLQKLDLERRNSIERFEAALHG